MHTLFKNQVKKIIDSHTDNSFQFIMKETVMFYRDGKITGDEINAFYHVAKVVNPLSWAIYCKRLEEGEV